MRRSLTPRLDLRNRFGERILRDFRVLGGLRPQPIAVGQAKKTAQPQIGASALTRIDPFVFSKTDPHQEHDLPMGKAFSSTPKACFMLPTGKISAFRA